MKICTKCKVEKQLTEFGKFTRGKGGLKPRCKECRRLEAAIRYIESKEYFAAYRAANLARILAASKRRWLTYDKTALRESANRRYRESPERQREAHSKYRRQNLGKFAFYAKTRYASKTGATPSYANLFFIEEAYDLALRRTVSSGKKWNVDHIVPLQSKLVCGLHVEHNLSVIPARANVQKGNRRWPHMPLHSVHGSSSSGNSPP